MQTFNPEDVDIRYAATDFPPEGNQPVRMLCPMHNDRQYSLMVYPANIHCHGCGFHIGRRYASLAFVLGLWDGRGDNFLPAMEAKRVAGRYAVKHVSREKATIKPLNKGVALPYRVQLWRYPELVRAFGEWRGISPQTIDRFHIGYDLCRWVIPIYDKKGELITLRYRLDDDRVESGAKYSGMSGRNQTYLYPANILQEYMHENTIQTLWIVEGELDVLPLWERGIPAVTTTNGAKQLKNICALLAAEGVGVRGQDSGTQLQIIIATDMDEAGHTAAREISLGCQEWGVDSKRALWDNGKDITEFLKSGGTIESVTYELPRNMGESEEKGRGTRRSKRPRSLLEP